MKRPAKVNKLYDIDMDVVKRLRAMKVWPLNKFEITQWGYMEVISAFEATLQNPTTMLYLDPPYPACVRGRDRYKHEMRDNDEHRGLCLQLSRLDCMVIISSYPNEIYDGLLPDWRTVDIPTMTRGGPRVERLWCNFQEPTYLHDPRFAGRDARERWRIGKRARRWREKYLALPPAERQAMMAELWAADDKAIEIQQRNP